MKIRETRWKRRMDVRSLSYKSETEGGYHDPYRAEMLALAPRLFHTSNCPVTQLVSPEGGHHCPARFDDMLDEPDEYRVHRNHKQYQVTEIPRPPKRPEPRTMPLWAALPVIAWLWWRGEL